MLVRLSSSGAEDSNNELHNDHARGAVDEDSSSTKSLNDPKRDWRRTNVNECSNQTYQEWILDRAELLEEDRSEVKDEVDTRQLLHHLHADAEKSPTEIGSAVGESTLEASRPRT